VPPLATATNNNCSGDQQTDRHVPVVPSVREDQAIPSVDEYPDPVDAKAVYNFSSSLQHIVDKLPAPVPPVHAFAPCVCIVFEPVI
jgi:hypothetical protein